MKKSYLFAILGILALYLTLYYLSHVFFTKQLKYIPSDIVLIVPTCPEKFTRSIGITKKGNTLCLGDQGIVRYSLGKTEKILGWKSEEAPLYISFHSDYLLMQQSGTVGIYYLPEGTVALQKTGEIPLRPNETAVSSRAEQREGASIDLYLSTYKEVARATDPKAALYKMQVTPQQVSIKSTVTLPHMEQIARIYHEKEKTYLVTKPQLSFVTPTYSIMTLEGENYSFITEFPCTDWVPHTAEKAIQIDCATKQSRYSLNYLDNKWNAATVPDSSEQLRFSGETITIEELSDVYRFRTLFATKDITKDALSTTSWEVYTIDSTTIEERVYNCSDFGESEQISLRVCTLNHE